MLPFGRKKTLILGTDLDDGALVRIMLDVLSTHVHVLGPPGSGKTRLLLWMFRALSADPDATIILFNVKGSLGRMARDSAIAQGLAKRLVLFDPAETRAIIGYNPLMPNGLTVATQAKAVREAIRAGWGQVSFDQTPQLARLLFLALAVVRELGLTLIEAVRLLQPRSAIRQLALRKLNDEYLRGALAYFDSLRDTRQEELAASTLARLESFVNDENIRRSLAQRTRSLNLGNVISEHKILIVNLEQYKPLRLDDVKLLGRMLVNDLLGNVFARPEGARSPVYLMLDEVEVFATQDLCSALDQGRELGLRCVLAHQHYDQLLEEDQTGRLLSSVKNCARTKVVFGGLSVEQIEPIAKEFFIDQFDPLSVKDEIRRLELDPVESRRLVPTGAIGFGKSWMNATGTSRGTSSQRGTGHGTGRSDTTIQSFSDGSASGSSESTGSSVVSLPSGETVESAFGGGGTSESSFSSQTATYGSATQESWSDFESEGESEAEHESQGFGGSMNANVSLTWTPFYEYRKQRVTGSREFWKLDEFLIKPIQRMHTLRRGCFALKVPGNRALYIRAPRVEERWLKASTRERALGQIFSQPYYATPEELAQEKRSELKLAPQRRRSTMKVLQTNDDNIDGDIAARDIPEPPDY